MSGGHFDYDQYKIGYIADEIQHQIEKNGKPKTREELKEEHWKSDDWYEKYPEDLYHHKYSDDVINNFKDAVFYLRMAQIYAHRIDWLLSADDGEETFLKRLEEDIKNIK